MPKLLNLQTGNRDLVDDADVAALVKTGKYAAPTAVATDEGAGGPAYVSPSVAADDAAFAAPSTGAAVASAQANTERTQETSGIGSFGKALGGSAVAGATVGLLNPYSADQAAHPYVSMAGNVLGAVATGDALGVGKLGEGVANAFGGDALGGILGNAAEGSAYGFGQGVQQLVTSDDPLTAEHVAGALSSNMLFGGAIGGAAGSLGKIFEKSLGRAGEALDSFRTTTDAATSLPGDLAGMDDAGLKAAGKDAAAQRVTDIKTETQSLEDLRVNQRAEVASQVKDLHESLATERPIFSALSNGDDLNPALKDIEGISDARVQLSKSYTALRSALDHTEAVAENPTRLIQPLQDRAVALEKIKAAMPEVQAALADDSRVGVLDHVDDAITQTRKQIADIRSLNSSKNPVTSSRLTELQAGPSVRETQIADARQAIKDAASAPDSIQKQMLGGSIYSGVASMMHALPIPGSSLAAPVVAAKLSKLITGRVFGTAAKVAGESAERSSKALASVLDQAPKFTKAAPVLATKVLAAARFAEGAPEVTGKQTLAALYKARAAELKSQTAYDPMGGVSMTMGARAAMAARLAPIKTVNPKLADQLETIGAAKAAFLSSKLLRMPDAMAASGAAGMRQWQPSDMDIRRWARYVSAAEDPGGVEERVAAGTVTPEDSEAYHAIYPARAADFRAKVQQGQAQLQKQLPYSKRIALSIFTGVPVDPAMVPNIRDVLQSSFSAESGSEGGTQAPKPQPQFGSIKKSIEAPSPAQARGNG